MSNLNKGHAGAFRNERGSFTYASILALVFYVGAVFGLVIPVLASLTRADVNLMAGFPAVIACLVIAMGLHKIHLSPIEE